MSERSPRTTRHAGRELARGLAALAALVVVIPGVPILLVLAAGNPWPGWERIRLGDERAIVVGVLATLAWVVWARFVLATVLEVPAQLAALRAERERAPHAPVAVAAPARGPAGGVGVLAARLVAAALVVLPLAGRATPVSAAPVTLPAVSAAAVPDASQPTEAHRENSPQPDPTLRTIEVVEGDTLVGLARRHLGQAARWREIFELNRDRPQVGGGRLTAPSVLQPGWRLLLPIPAEPVAAAPGPASADEVSIVAGDTLWDLARDRLARSGHEPDDARIAAYVGEIVVANPDVVEDPDLIFPGERIVLPASERGVAAPTAPPPQPTGTVPVSTATPSTTTPRATAPSTTTSTVHTVEPTAAARPADASVDTARSTTSSSAPAGGVVEPDVAGPVDAEIPDGSPAPIGVGEAALLSTGLVALLAARRRTRLRAARPRARVPEPPPERVETERALRTVDAQERLLRLDVAVRAAAAALLETPARPAVMRVGEDGAVELVLTGEAALPRPWQQEQGRWVLPGSVSLERLAETARSVGAPCLALTQLGVDVDGHDVFADLEALGVLAIRGRDEETEPVLRGIAATLATSMFADVLNLVGVDVEEQAFLDHRLAHQADGVEAALELATTLIGTTASARQSTFVLRARHTSGEAWEPAVVLTGPRVAHEVTPELVRSVSRRHGGVALVAAGDVPDGPWTLRPAEGAWRLEPLGLGLVPVGLTALELATVYDVLHDAGAPLIEQDDDQESGTVGAPRAAVEPDDEQNDDAPPEPPWQLMVRLLGPVDVVDRNGRRLVFERSKTLELIAWLTLHRDRSTRTGARTALWDLDVRDATFANVVSEARRAMARHVPPPEGEEWLERTLSEQLPLHPLVISDADAIRARLDRARSQSPERAIETLRPAVELIRDVPFAGAGYTWPDPEGITSNLLLLAASAATELAGHLLSLGDADGALWASGRGLQILPGHEELVALRMRAHHRTGDLSAVRLEWETYERVLDADPWSGGEPASKLVALRRELLSTPS